MKRHLIPKNPRIVIFANDTVGLKVAKYLKKRKENIIALVLHPDGSEKLRKEIREVFLTGNGLIPTERIFFADKLDDPTSIKGLKDLKPDFAISAWFGYILKSEIIDIFPSGIINFHNSFLPYCRGKYPHVWALYNESIYGVALHYIDHGIDTGDIIARRVIKIRDTDSAGSLYDNSLREIVNLFKDVWPSFKNNRIKSKFKKNGTHHYAKEVRKLDEIYLTKKYLAKDLINQLRARSFNNRTYAYYIKNGKKIYVKIALSKDHYF